MHQLIFILFICLFSASIQSPIKAKVNDFSIDVIHRDSPLSPLYDAAATPSELMRKAALRSLSRAKFFHSYTHSDSDDEPIESSLSVIGGEYVTKLYMGTPPVAFFAIADTGSNLIWAKCSSPTNNRENTKIFNPLMSSTYDNVLFDSEFCQALPKKWSGFLDSCEYSHKYRDGSYTRGNLSTDTFYLHSTSIERAIPFEEIVFGCTEENYLHDGDSLIQGIVGLGAGVLSLVSQLKTEIEPKYFSYCLVPMTSTGSSKLKFGAGAKISETGVVSRTPITLKHPPQYYHLSLESISIGKYSTRTRVDQGNIMIDSGTPLTILHTSLYNEVKTIVTNAIDSSPMLHPPDEFDLCYEDQSIKLPENIVFHFTGIEIHLRHENTFETYDDGVTCLLIVPDDHVSIFGSMAQVNFQVEFDLQNLQVSFIAREDCTDL